MSSDAMYCLLRDARRLVGAVAHDTRDANWFEANNAVRRAERWLDEAESDADYDPADAAEIDELYEALERAR